jgi:sugar/nucleoside kinase (ribokinase family)
LRVLRHLTPEYLRAHKEAFRTCDLVAFDMNLSEAAMREAIHLSSRISHKPLCVDPTSTVLASRLRPYLSLINIVTPNIAEAEELLQCAPIRSSAEALQAARHLVAAGVEIAVITQAERGACYATDTPRAVTSLRSESTL